MMQDATDAAFEVGRQAHEKTSVTPALREVMALHKANKVNPATGDVERVARAIHEADKEGDPLKGAIYFDLVKDMRTAQATAAISAMTPDIWNAAIEAAAEACQSHPEEGSEDLGPGIALAIEIIRALKSPKPPTC